MNNEKKQNIILGLMIFLFVIFISIIIAWALGYISINKANTETSKKGEIEVNETEESSKDEEKVEEVRKGVFVPFNASKCKNPRPNNAKYFINTPNCRGICVECIDGEAYMFKQFFGDFSEEDFKNRYGDINLPDCFEKKKVEGFDKKVVDTFISIASIDETLYPMILFLMEDGTVEYMKSGKCISTGNLKTAGKVKGVSDVVRIVGGSVATDYGGGYTVMAITSSGEFYDILNIFGYNDIDSILGRH